MGKSWGRRDRLFQIRGELRTAYRAQHGSKSISYDALNGEIFRLCGDDDDIIFMSRRERGRAVGLTITTWKGTHPLLREVLPFDATDQELEEARRLRRIDKSNERQRRMRARLKAARIQSNDLDVREEALLVILSQAGERSITSIMSVAKGGIAWRQPNGRPLEGGSLRKAVHRALRSLAERPRPLARIREDRGKRNELVWLASAVAPASVTQLCPGDTETRRQERVTLPRKDKNSLAEERRQTSVTLPSPDPSRSISNTTSVTSTEQSPADRRAHRARANTPTSAQEDTGVSRDELHSCPPRVQQEADLDIPAFLDRRQKPSQNSH